METIQYNRLCYDIAWNIYTIQILLRVGKSSSSSDPDKLANSSSLRSLFSDLGCFPFDRMSPLVNFTGLSIGSMLLEFRLCDTLAFGVLNFKLLFDLHGE